MPIERSETHFTEYSNSNKSLAARDDDILPQNQRNSWKQSADSSPPIIEKAAQISSLSSAEKSFTDLQEDLLFKNACIERCRASILARKSGYFWALFAPVQGTENLFSCAICSPQVKGLNSVDKKARKGFCKYSSFSGSGAFKRHLNQQHPELYDHICEKLQRIDDQEVRSHLKRAKNRKKAEARDKKRAKGNSAGGTVDVASFFVKPKPYPKESSERQLQDRNLVLMVGKSGIPLSTVDNKYSRKYVSSIDQRTVVPSRKRLTTKLIPSFVSELERKHVIPVLKCLQTVSLSFDLWMSRGCQDIFNIIVHGLDGMYRQDGGANLSTCANAVSTISYCQALELDLPFQGQCIAQILSGACNAALGIQNYEKLPMVNVKEVKKKLQSCITWTKKIGRGRLEWYKFCDKHNMPRKIIPSSVKTRFMSVVTMMSLMLEYRTVIEDCFSSQPSIQLQERVPSPSTWEVVKVIVEMLDPIMKACVLNQTRRFWLISDAIDKMVKLYLHYSRLLGDIPNYPIHMAEANVSVQCQIFKKRIACTLKEKLTPVIQPLLSFSGALRNHHHYFLALALDPEFKTLQRPFMELHAENLLQVQETAKSYDRAWILPTLVSIYKRQNNISTPSTPDANLNTSAAEHLSSGSIPLCFPELGEEGLACSSTDSVIEQHVKQELLRYRRATFSCPTDSFMSEGKLKWLSDNRSKCPTVIELARHVLGIPPTQIENERIFSMAGHLSFKRRSRLTIDLLDNLVAVSQNHLSDDGDMDASRIPTDYSSIADTLVDGEEHNENDDDSE